MQLLRQMRRQAEIAIETCDVILFFVDGRQGMTAGYQAISLSRGGISIDLDKCTGCGLCYGLCPSEALTPVGVNV